VDAADRYSRPRTSWSRRVIGRLSIASIAMISLVDAVFPDLPVVGVEAIP